ncbi:MAG: nicotinate-nucleotide--dimethylbenzimidazole phosphoribosyltransferase [Candidatus Calescibacterium sp.]|nr:nicotinate-nucleotide--dimethylbenzimidazole phosphoribosyltransferase [Candidatus Calescibacterium sp.]MDW8087073.1 nicotinate-nucleotide--dimethylbenzimidazole phosphoribosyltransferase [Candidatus Calescibacterium sp.]
MAREKEILEKVRARLDDLTKPKDSLGYLEKIIERYASITEKTEFKLPLKKIISVFCGDHGIAEEGVSAYPQEVTKQMVYNFVRGGAAINVIGKYIGADVFVVDVGVNGDIEKKGDGMWEFFISHKVNHGTKNFLKEPAMTPDEAKKSIEVGYKMSEIAQKYDIAVPGDMGIANTTPASAIVSFITEQPPEKVVGRGTGIDDQKLKKKIQVVREAIEKWRPKNGMEALEKFGGFEIGAIAGFILGCAEKKIPVVVDGIISLAGFCVAYSLDRSIPEKVFFGHKTYEPGGAVISEFFGQRPIVDLEMRLGEGTGGAIATTIIEIALSLYMNMATFSSAGVSRKID